MDDISRITSAALNLELITFELDRDGKVELGVMTIRKTDTGIFVTLPKMFGSVKFPEGMKAWLDDSTKVSWARVKDDIFGFYLDHEDAVAFRLRFDL